MQHEMYTKNYWTNVTRYVYKQLVDVCSMICKQTITGCMQHDM